MYSTCWVINKDTFLLYFWRRSRKLWWVLNLIRKKFYWTKYDYKKCFVTFYWMKTVSFMCCKKVLMKQRKEEFLIRTDSFYFTWVTQVTSMLLSGFCSSSCDKIIMFSKWWYRTKGDINVWSIIDVTFRNISVYINYIIQFLNRNQVSVFYCRRQTAELMLKH